MDKSFLRSFSAFTFLLFAITLFITTPVMATDFYVAAGGVDYAEGGSASLSSGNSCDDANAPCGTITRATGVARAGDVINLSAGTFGKGETFPLYIKSGVALVGAGDGKTIIEGSDANALVVIEQSDDRPGGSTRISGVLIRGNQEGAGISIGGKSINKLMKDGAVDGFQDGVQLINPTSATNGRAWNTDVTVTKASVINNFTGIGLFAYNGAFNALIKSNMIGGNNVGVELVVFGGPTYTLSTTHCSSGPCYSPSGYSYGTSSNYVSAYTTTIVRGTVNLFMKNNVLSGNNYGVFGIETFSGYYGSSIYLNIGPDGGNSGHNTFNNTVNIATNATVNTDNNWWPGGADVAYANPNDNPLSCGLAAATVVSGGTITISATAATTFFVDHVGAADNRLTVDIGGTPATGVALDAAQTSFTATAANTVGGLYTVTVTNPGGQVCTLTNALTVNVSGCTDAAATNYDANANVDDGSCTYAAVVNKPKTTNSPPYDPAGGGTDWLNYPENGQTNVPPGTVLKWIELTDANGDVISYTLYLCHADDWDSDANDCTEDWMEITVLLANNASDLRSVMTAKAGGVAGAAALFAIGFIGAMRSRRGRAYMMALMMIASAGMIASCSTDDSTESADEATTYTVCDDEAGIICEDIESSYTLAANTEYHWYVNAADGAGGSTNSDTRSFTTGD